MDLFAFDRSFYQRGYATVAGIDEAGRGPWAGPVVAAAVILPQDVSLPGLNDSKKLTPRKREQLFPMIMSAALAAGIEIVGHTIIDRDNILQATFAAMRGALSRLSVKPGCVLVDGCLAIPGITLPQHTVVGGDAMSACIAAASILAKVTRDRIMSEYAEQYPQYRFDEHKGYGTKAHSEALAVHGPSPIHRKSFAPVRELLEAGRRG